MDISSVLVVGIIAGASLISALSIMIVRKLMEDGETAMVKMSLKQSETVKEFRYLLMFHSVVVPALILVTIAGITEQKIYIDAGRALIGLQSIGITAIFLKWWKRF